MKKLIIAILITSLAILGLVSSAPAEMVSLDEISRVADNWITLIIYKKGDWGGSKTAGVQEIEEFRRGERVLGYFCRVKPQGFIVTSLHKELPSVKAYSATCDLDPKSDEGLTDVIKGGMERVLDAIQERIGPIDSVLRQELEGILEINYRQSWEELSCNVETFKSDLQSGGMKIDYQMEEVLLSSGWAQADPYHQQCPAATGCAHCVVGCVATAGAQIMRFWNWPPYGEGSHSYTWNNQNLSATFSDTYGWPYMPDYLYTWSSQAQIDSTSELCYEVGVAVDMNYGCTESGAYMADLKNAFKDHFRYDNNIDWKFRPGYPGGAVGWFNRMKVEFDRNRPVAYAVPGHAIVGDGWQEYGNPVVLRQYHMNYGWAGQVPWGDPNWSGIFNSNTWYTLDALPGTDTTLELMILNIRPEQYLDSLISGTYAKLLFPYRYFDRDAAGGSATFQSGNRLQFLPNVTVTCTSSTGGTIRFNGSSSDNTLLFTKGDRSKGILIEDGVIKLYENGSIRFAK